MSARLAVSLALGLLVLLGCDVGEMLTVPSPGYSTTVDNVSNFTNNTVDDAQPDISGDRIVWVQQGDIVMREFGTSTDVPIAGTADSEFDPAISGDLIVWTVSGGSGRDVWGYDLASGSSFPIATAAVPEGNADVDGPYVVFERQGATVSDVDIWLYDHTSGMSYQITSGPEVEIAPAISGSRIVWQMVNSSSDIYTCTWDAVAHTCSAAPVVATADAEVQPAVFGDVVVWNVPGPNELWVRDLGSGDPPRRIGQEIRDWNEPASVSAGLVVWGDYRNATSPTGTTEGSDIFLYDLALNEEVPVYVDPLRLDRFPAVSGDKIVWQSLGDPTVGQDLLVAELTIDGFPPIDELRHLIETLREGTSPGISNAGTAQSLKELLDVVELHESSGNDVTACRMIDQFIATTEKRAAAAGGQLITPEAAALLIQHAEDLKQSIGCGA